MSSSLNTSEYLVSVYFTLHEEGNLNNYMLIIYIVYNLNYIIYYLP